MYFPEAVSWLYTWTKNKWHFISYDPLKHLCLYHPLSQEEHQNGCGLQEICKYWICLPTYDLLDCRILKSRLYIFLMFLYAWHFKYILILAHLKSLTISLWIIIRNKNTISYKCHTNFFLSIMQIIDIILSLRKILWYRTKK